MLFDPTTTAHLKPWLVRTLEPICDAEPGALADYILALLKHDAPESDMRKELVSQLEEFLEKETTSFIDMLFTVLRTKSYLPYTAASPSATFSKPQPPVDTGIPIPVDALISPSISASPSRGLKRSLEQDDRDSHPPAKGPRVDREGQLSRYPNGRGAGNDGRPMGNWTGRGGMNGYGDMHMRGGMNGRHGQNYLPPDQRRGICRDYHNNGYCARGAFCKYSHGEDAVIPDQMFTMNGVPMPNGAMPFIPMFANGGIPFGMMSGGAYDPHEARMDMRPQAGISRAQRPPLLSQSRREGGGQVSGELPVIQDLTPKVPSDETLQDVSMEASSSRGASAPLENGMSPMNGQLPRPMDVEMSIPMPPPMHGNNHFQGGSRGGRGRGTFTGEVHSFRPERKNDKTLVVEKIPEDKLSLEAVNGWFKRFGTVTNVAIDAINGKALVSFMNHEEAHAAWKSEEAVFNNRFVRLFWHRPMEGHGQTGARMLAASAPLVKNMTAQESSPIPPTPPSESTQAMTHVRKASTSTAANLAAKLEQQIAEQKSLMALLSTATGDEKKRIMARLRSLGEEMKRPSSTQSPAPTQKRTGSAPPTEDREQKEKERLDKELEMHSAAAAMDDNESPQTLEELKARLGKLQAEATSLGLTGAEGHPPGFATAYRPYRGRGRVARSYYRGAGRGGPPRASMKLDNRPRKLLIKGVHDDGIQALRDWYETTGILDSVDNTDSGDVVVSFKTRAAAEQGLAKGQNIPTVGSVQISWFTGRPPNTTSSTPAPGSQDSRSKDEPRIHTPELEQSHIQDEEVAASGWGDGDEDSMGML